MRKISFILFAIGLMLSNQVSGQNVFHDRNYWKENPTVEQIIKDMNSGSDIASLNANAFDAVTWALIEKTSNETVKFLLDQPGNEVNKLTHDGRTYIFWAAYKDNLEMMQYLLDRGARTDVIDDHGYSLLNFAAVTGQLNTRLYDFILENGGSVSETNKTEANALLLVAPFVKDMGIVDYLNSKGLELTATDNNGYGVPEYAAKSGNKEFLGILLERNLKFTTTRNGGNAMILASQGMRGAPNTLETYKFLESKGVDPNVTTHEGTNPLHAIAYDVNDLSVFKYFIEKGVSVNQQNAEGNIPFLHAANSNKESVVEYLGSLVSNMNHQNNDGETALMLSLRRNTPAVVKWLLDNGSDISISDKKGNTPAYYLIAGYSRNNPDNFRIKQKEIQARGFDLSKPQPNGSNLFHLVIEAKKFDLLEWAHKNGADINARNKDGMTPLLLASMVTDNVDPLNYLLSIGADKSIHTEFDESAFDLAIQNEFLNSDKANLEFLK